MNYKKIIQLVKSTKSIVNDESLRNNISVKGEADFVTQVDLKISEFLSEQLKKLYPEIGFMSEENCNNELPTTRFILDPIDGTTNLIYDYKQSSVSLALLNKDEIVFGIVYNPFSRETFYAIKGKGAYRNGIKMAKLLDRDVKDCLIEFGAGSTRKHQAEEVFKLGLEIFKECLDIRRICSSALAICYIAAGRINGYFEKRLKPWDYAAASLILSECGGISSDWKNIPLQFDYESTIIAGSAKAHSFLLNKINKNQI